MDSEQKAKENEPPRIINHEEPVKGMFRVGPIVQQIRLDMVRRELERATESKKRREALSN
jgi:hypothetical protein